MRKKLQNLLALTVAVGMMSLGMQARAETGDQPQRLEIFAWPSLYPAFQRDVTDYVVRCGTSPVRLFLEVPRRTRVAVDGGRPYRTGRFSVDVQIGEGERFPLSVRSGRRVSRHHVRCLPLDFPGFTAQRLGPTHAEWYIAAPSLRISPGQGFVFSRYVAVFDTQGVPVWWMRSAGDTVPVDAKLLRPGVIAWLHLGLPDAEEHSLDGALVRTLRTVGDGADFHDIQLLPSGNYLMAKYYHTSGVDLTECGGAADGRIVDNEIQELSPEGDLVWSWDARDHIPPSEVSPTWADRCTRDPADVYHFNSFEAVGNVLVISFRNLDAVYAISRSTGEVLWKLGGTTRSESLVVVNDPTTAAGGTFGGQHDARILADGTLTVHDNGSGRPRQPRAVQFALDLVARTATLIEEVTDPDVPRSVCCGSARKLPAGNWVAAWGASPYVTEITPEGARVFRLEFSDDGVFSYRAHPVPFGQLKRVSLRKGMDAMHPR